MEYSRVLNIVQSRLAAQDHRVDNAVRLAGNVRADIVAERSYFNKGMYLVFQYVFVTKIENPGLLELQELREAQLQYIKHKNWLAPLRGLQFGYAIINCVFCASANKGITNIVESRPEHQVGLFELPVLCEANWGQTHYFKGKVNTEIFTELQSVVASCFDGVQPSVSKGLLSSVKTNRPSTFTVNSL